MRAFRFLVALFFLMLAFYETSGKHPVVWILVFGSMSLMSVLAMFNFFLKPFLAFALAGLLLYMLFRSSALTEALTEHSIADLWYDLNLRYFVYAGLCFLVCTHYLWAALRDKSAFNRLQKEQTIK